MSFNDGDDDGWEQDRGGVYPGDENLQQSYADEGIKRFTDD